MKFNLTYEAAPEETQATLDFCKGLVDTLLGVYQQEHAEQRADKIREEGKSLIDDVADLRVELAKLKEENEDLKAELSYAKRNDNRRH